MANNSIITPTQVTTFSVPSYSQILQSLLNDYNSITTYYGYNINTDPGSEIYLRLATFSGPLAVLYNLMNILTNSKMIDTALGADLDRAANNLGLYRRGATSAEGFVLLGSSVSQTLLAGTILTGPNSLQYQVSTSGIYNANSNVPITSVDTGASTNLPVGAILNWSVSLPNMQTVASVSVAVTGGADNESDDTLRGRVYLSLQSPPQMGNAQQLATLAGTIDGVVQQGFVYSNFNGAGTQLLALTGYQTTSYIGRDIPHLLLDGYVKPYGVLQLQPGLVIQATGYGAYNQYTAAWGNTSHSGPPGGSLGPNLSSDTSMVYGQLPGTIANPFASVITTVNNVPTDIAAVLTLPYPVGAANNGVGNGWMDYTPWPVPDGYYVNQGYCSVTNIHGTGSFIVGGNGSTGYGITVSAPSSGSVHTGGNGFSVPAATYTTQVPTTGTTHIQWINRSDAQDSGWVVVTATILDALDIGNDTWSLILDTPFVFANGASDFYGNIGIVVGDFIFPASINAQNYLDILLQQYALLGPGQVTSSVGLLSLGASRYPSANTQFPNSMGVQVERALVSNNNEVYAASVNSGAFISQSTGKFNTASAYNTAFSAPTTNAPPNIFIPRNAGFYPAETYNFGNH